MNQLLAKFLQMLKYVSHLGNKVWDFVKKEPIAFSLGLITIGLMAYQIFFIEKQALDIQQNDYKRTQEAEALKSSPLFSYNFSNDYNGIETKDEGDIDILSVDWLINKSDKSVNLYKANNENNILFVHDINQLLIQTYSELGGDFWDHNGYIKCYILPGSINDSGISFLVEIVYKKGVKTLQKLIMI
jgi:hypothetical protein